MSFANAKLPSPNCPPVPLHAARRGRPPGVLLYAGHIRHYRLNAGWTQEQLSELMQISVRTISSAERGRPVSLRTAKQLADLFRQPLELLVERW